MRHYRLLPDTILKAIEHSTDILYLLRYNDRERLRKKEKDKGALFIDSNVESYL